jgi:hypothetical protein
LRETIGKWTVAESVDDKGDTVRTEGYGLTSCPEEARGGLSRATCSTLSEDPLIAIRR